MSCYSCQVGPNVVLLVSLMNWDRAAVGWRHHVAACRSVRLSVCQSRGHRGNRFQTAWLSVRLRRSPSRSQGCVQRALVCSPACLPCRRFQAAAMRTSFMTGLPRASGDGAASRRPPSMPLPFTARSRRCSQRGWVAAAAMQDGQLGAAKCMLGMHALKLVDGSL
jgi:hypothetical protein